MEENNKRRHTDSGGETKPADLTGFFFFFHCFLPNLNKLVLCVEQYSRYD